MDFRPFLLALALPLYARADGSPVAMISNLGTPGPQGGGIGDLQTLSPGYGFGVGFITGGTALTLSSVALEMLGLSPPGFHVQLFTFVPPTTPPPPAWPLVLSGELGQVATDPRPTLWPGVTTYFDFFSSTPITLAPHSAYVIAATEGATGTDNNALRFGYTETYAVNPNWQIYPAQNMNQWYLNPGLGGWSPTPVVPSEGMVLEVNVVPEPGSLSLLVLAATILACWKFSVARANKHQPSLALKRAFAPWTPGDHSASFVQISTATSQADFRLRPGTGVKTPPPNHTNRGGMPYVVLNRIANHADFNP